LASGDDRNIYKKYEDSVDFVALKSKRWAYSKFNLLELIYEVGKTAMVHMNFAIYNGNDEVMLRAIANYLLVNESYEWNKSGFCLNKITEGQTRYTYVIRGLRAGMDDNVLQALIGVNLAV
jgi:hypothetical protein